MISPGNTSQKPQANGRAGIRVRTLSVLLLVTALASVVLSFYELRGTAQQSRVLYEIEVERQLCDDAISRFMDGSDYLTNQIEQYVIKGDRAYMDAYWTEVNETRSRDLAVETILGSDITQEEREEVVAGKAESDGLISGEIWAMRMVSESLGMAEEEMPPEVAGYKLSRYDAALSSERQREAAIDYIFGPDYLFAKDAIRESVNAFRNGIAVRYSEDALTTLEATEHMTSAMAVCLVSTFLLFILATHSFTELVLSPLVSFYKQLTQLGENPYTTLKPRGARELRQFATAFNSLSSQAERIAKSLERMGYIDYLTDVPNRASITEYVGSLLDGGVRPLGLLIIDIDDFKRFNDTYGHATGDVVLRQVAGAVCSGITEERGLAGRLCGEEFIVVLKNADEDMLRATAELVLRRVRELDGRDVELLKGERLSISVSIGGVLWLGELPMSFIGLLSRADKALYYSKNTGKDRYTCYGEIIGLDV